MLTHIVFNQEMCAFSIVALDLDLAAIDSSTVECGKMGLSGVVNLLLDHVHAGQAVSHKDAVDALRASQTA